MRVHRGNEGADAIRCLRLSLEEVHELEARVVVHQDERVLVAAVERRREGAHYVRVHESSRVSRFVLRLAMCDATGIGLGADGARERGRGGYVRWRVGGSMAESAEAVEGDVEPSVERGRHVICW